MNIAIDALGIHYYGGGRSAVLGLLEGIADIDHENKYRIYLNQPEPSIGVGQTNIHQIISPFTNRFLTRIWAQLIFPTQLKKFDLIHYTKNLGVFGLGIPSVVTIHDLTTLVHPELFPWFDVWYWKTVQKMTVNHASKVIAVSETTAHDVGKFYAVPAEKIEVIYNSVDRRFKPASQSEITRVKIKYHLPERYLLHAGRIDLKKKLTLLVEAFALAKKIYGRDFPFALVLVGEVYLKSEDQTLLPTIERLGLSNEVLFTGGVPDEDLPPIYSGAEMTLSTSIHEGFGLSAVESLACGTPLVAYRAAALTEVVGEAALLLDLPDCESIANAIIRISNDPDLKQDLIQKGLLRAQYFQGERNAHQTLKLYAGLVI